MIVDVHAHVAPTRYLDAYRRAAVEEFGGDSRALVAVEQIARFPAPFSDAADQVEARLREMDAAGVERQVMSLAAMFPYFRDEDRAVRVARVANESIAELVDQHPDRFSMFASVPLPHADAAAREVEYWTGTAGVIGVELTTSVFGSSVANARFDPVYDAVQRGPGIVFYHPTGDGLAAPLVTDYGLEVSTGTSFEDTILAIQLAVEGIPTRYPTVDHILPHFGGMVSLLLERLDNQGSTLGRTLTEPISATLSRFYYDTVSHGSYAALTASLNAFGAARLVPGSDYPIVQLFEPYDKTFSWITDPRVDNDVTERILGKNAQELFDAHLSSPQPTRPQGA